MRPNNQWCEVLGIERPDLGFVKDHSEANNYSCLIVALLECGEPMTLVQVAARFEEAGVAERGRALRSLQRCKPARAPVYRVDDLYHLDPHDREARLWISRLDLRPPRPAIRVVRPELPPLPEEDMPLSLEELDEAWAEASLNSWSTQRLALAVLDAHERPLAPGDVVAFVAQRTRRHLMREVAHQFHRRGSPVLIGEDGRWSIAAGAEEPLRAARRAARALIEKSRKYAAMRPDPDVTRAYRLAYERKQEANARRLAAMNRALLVGFPAGTPRAVALLDVGEHQPHTFVEDELAALHEHLARYDLLGAEDVRGLLRALDFDPGQRVLAELGPPQKTKKLNKRGRTLKITTTLLVEGSCALSRPFGDPHKLAGYLAKGETTRLRRRLVADVKSLYALYQYGLLHGCVRLRWGFLDERLPAPWAHEDGQRLYHLKNVALETGRALEVVVGAAPGWSEPWARARLVHVHASGWQKSLVDEEGCVVDDGDVQAARFARLG